MSPTPDEHDEDTEELLHPGVACDVAEPDGGQGGAGEVQSCDVRVHLDYMYLYIYYK